MLVSRYVPCLLVLAACAPGARSSGQGPDSADVEVEDTATPRPLPTPTWSAAEAAAAIAQALEGGPPDPQAIEVRYVALMAAGDAACPGDATNLMDSIVPLSGCTSSTGYTYAGVSVYTVLGPPPVRGFYLSGDFTIESPDGRRMIAGGISKVSIEETGGAVSWDVQWGGTWREEGGEGWLADGIGGAMQMSGSLDGEEAEATADGVLTTRGISLDLQDLRWSPRVCDGNPVGIIRVRDPSGLWATVDLRSSCDGCGALSWDDSSEAETVCIDLVQAGKALLILPGGP